MNVPVYVPKDPTCSRILAGSAIVGGQTLGNGRILVDYEGDRNNAPGLKTIRALRCLP